MEIFKEGLSVTLSEADITLLTERVNSEIKERIEGAKNDPEYISSLQSKFDGKTYNLVEKAIKRVTGADFDGIDKDLKYEKRIKAMLDHAITEIKAGKDETNQEIQDKWLATKAELQKIRDEEIPEIEAKYKLKFDGKNIESSLTKKLAGMDIIQERRGPALTYANAVLKDRYKLGWDEDITITTHKDLQPVINDKPADLDMVLSHVLDEGGFLQKSNGNPKPADPANPRPAEGHSEAAQRMLDSFKA